MSTQVNSTELKLVAEIAKRLANGGLDVGAVQALLEAKPTGESSLDSKLIEVMPGAAFAARDFEFCGVINGQRMKRHRNGGGLVSADQSETDESQPYVSADSYIHWDSVVIGTSRVIGSHVTGSRINFSRVSGSYVFSSWITSSEVTSSEVIDSRISFSRVIDSRINFSRVIDSEVTSSRISLSHVIDSEVVGRSLYEQCVTE